MSTIVGMHNAVNEYTWQLLLGWEKRLHPETATQIRLKKFSGDAQNFTLKVRPEYGRVSRVCCAVDFHVWCVCVCVWWWVWCASDRGCIEGGRVLPQARGTGGDPGSVSPAYPSPLHQVAQVRKWRSRLCSLRLTTPPTPGPCRDHTTAAPCLRRIGPTTGRGGGLMEGGRMGEGEAVTGLPFPSSVWCVP